MQSINEGNIPVNLRRALLKSWHFGHETKTKKERQKYKKNLICYPNKGRTYPLTPKVGQWLYF